MITYQDCPSCGARKIHSTVSLCEVCETWEKAEQALNAQDEVLTSRYNEQLARANAAQQERNALLLRVDTLTSSLRGLLLSRDASWTGGHDWQEAVDQACRALGVEPGDEG